MTRIKEGVEDLRLYIHEIINRMHRNEQGTMEDLQYTK